MAARKLLFYTQVLKAGGAERVFAALAGGMAALGHEVIFAVDCDSEDRRVLLSPNIRFLVLAPDHFHAVQRLAQLLRQEKPDLSISVASISNLKHVLAAALSHRLGRSVLSYQGYWASEPLWLGRFSYALTPILTRLAARTICISAGLKSYLKIHFGAAPTRTVAINNPVLTGPLSPASNVRELLARKPIILTSGPLVPQQNLPLLIRAFAQMKRRDAELLILGDGPHRPVIEAEIDRRQVRDRVKLMGYVAEPWNLYVKARCFALSSDSEALGLVVAEAMANGLSVVSTNSDGPREILDRGRYGWLVPTGDEKALTIALDAALDDPGEPGPRIERAKMYSLDKAVMAYEALIDDVLTRRRSPW